MIKRFLLLGSIALSLLSVSCKDTTPAVGKLELTNNTPTQHLFVTTELSQMGTKEDFYIDSGETKTISYTIDPVKTENYVDNLFIQVYKDGEWGGGESFYLTPDNLSVEILFDSKATFSAYSIKKK